ncbi:MAG: RNA polymerase factor sigma-54 [Raineya sp.]|jgi:RNA polymerase sigma-54 factor|nr:RNA polymerase factor sigma-54 [Raineya sp.]
MQKLGLHQTLQQKLSPQQIQFIKLLQIPTIELKARIQEELEINPALEEGKEDIFDQNESVSSTEDSYEEDYDNFDDDSYDDDYSNDSDEVNISDYIQAEEDSYKTQMNNGGGDDEDKQMPISVGITFFEALDAQLGYLRLDERESIIGKQIIGSLDNDGYLRREIPAIVNDLAFTQNVETDQEEVLDILRKIQRFDPAGVGARNLQECLLIQLKRKKEEELHTDEERQLLEMAIEIIEDNFEEFTKKHYPKIEKRLNISEEELKPIIKIITKLNPKPGETEDGESITQYVIPDFILTNNNGKLDLTLNSRNAPELRISRSFAEMLDTYHKSNKNDKAIKETVSFVKQKLDAAKWFIDAIKQRQQTLLKTMQAIIEFQYDFFLEGDESKFKPMILKDVAEKIAMDISTVSRVANSKTVQTEFGVYPLKYFFSEGIATETGEDVSSREVKAKLKEFVDNEDKKKPLSDDKLEKMLHDSGYLIARRTVAKYREQLGIPVARLRKEI